MSQLMLINPRRRRRKTTRRRSTAKRRNPVRRRRRTTTRRAAPRARRRTYRRRNPRGLFSGSGLQASLMPAVTGAGGAMGLNIVMGMLPLPDNLKSGVAGSAVKIGTAIVAGRFLKGMVGKKNSDAMVVGAITVLAYDMIKPAIQQMFPALTLSEYLSGYNSGILPYGTTPQMGYVNAAPWSPGQIDAYGSVPTENEVPAYSDNGMGEYLSGYGW